MKKEDHSPLGIALMKLADCHMGAKDLNPLSQQECGFIIEYIGELNGNVNHLERVQGDLSMMMRRMVQRLRKHDGHDVIASQAMILLTKHGLHGSILRSSEGKTGEQK